ncbi:MAG: hypothetical protein ACPGSD_02260 [Flavobacteriales bacterium]
MGLDITHFKATKEKAEPLTLFYIGNDIYGDTGAEIREKFDNFNVDFDHFQKYIQEIDVPTEVETVIIVKGVENLKHVKDHFKSTESSFIVRKNEEQLQKELKDFEEKKGYQNLKKNFKDFSYTSWIILNYYIVEKKEGFYFKNVGEQRKGMNRKFWDKFCKGDISNFALKEDFDYAFSCVDKNWSSDYEKSVLQRKKLFKKNLLITLN